MNYPNFSPLPPSTGLIGHRGVAALAPENTLSSFKLAAEQGIDWIEFDLRLTKDNELIIFHDDDFERTTNGFGLVHETALSEIVNLDAGSWFAKRFIGEKIPLFAQDLPEILNQNLYLNIELKVPPTAPIEHGQILCKKLATVLNSQWPKGQKWPLVSSFDWSLLSTIRALQPDIPLGFLSEDSSMEMILHVAKTPNAAFHCHYQSITPEILRCAHEHAVPLLTYTVNQPSLARELLNAGVFGIFSDNPQELILSGVRKQAQTT